MSITAQGTLLLDVEELREEPPPGGLTRLQPDTTRVTLRLDGRDNPYHVEFHPAPYLLLGAGGNYGHPSAKFTHPNLLAAFNDIFEYKHSLPSGGKYWTAKAGRRFYMALPKTAFALKTEAGYSYPKFVVAGEEITLSVSGGTINGWTDWVPVAPMTSIDHAVRTLKRLAAAAYTVEQCRELGIQADFPTLPERRHDRFRELAGCGDIRGQLDAGKKIVLGHGYTWAGEKGPFEIRNRRKGKQQWVVWDDRKLGCTTVEARMIDWIETIRANDLPLPDVTHGQFNHIGALIPRED